MRRFSKEASKLLEFYARVIYVNYTDFDIRLVLSTEQLLIRKKHDRSIKVNEEIATDPNQHAKDRTQPSQVMVEAQADMLQLLREGQKIIGYLSQD
jgi:hypothetical protein